MSDANEAAETPGSPGYRVHAAYLDRLVADQEARKKSMEERGIAVLTTSAALVSLLFGLVAVITGVDDFALPDDARPWLAVAMVAFVLAAVLGMATNFPRKYSNADAAHLNVMFEDKYWGESELRAQRRVSVTQHKVFARAQMVNGQKAWGLFAAMAAQFVAVVALTVAVEIILAQ